MKEFLDTKHLGFDAYLPLGCANVKHTTRRIFTQPRGPALKATSTGAWLAWKQNANVEAKRARSQWDGG